MSVVKAFFRVIGQLLGGLLVSILTVGAFLGAIFGAAKITDLIADFLVRTFGEGWTAFANKVAAIIPWIFVLLIAVGVAMAFSVSVYNEYLKLKTREGHKYETMGKGNLD